ncbi:MAG: hypothetical protein IAE83_16540 [Anaerolinea sp.]|nr:hypothetical protein [Anaerolinea sp.]
MNQLPENAFTTTLRGKADSLIEPPHLLSLSWLKSHEWAVVPVYEDIDYRFAEWISEAIRGQGYTTCYALTLPLSDSRIFEVEVSQESLYALGFGYISTQNLLIVPENLSFAILKMSTEYFILGGDHSFVRKAVGTSFETARKIFERYANDEILPPAFRDHLLKEVLKRYASFDGLPTPHA